MRAEQIKKFLPLLTAISEGKKIQYKNGFTWSDISSEAYWQFEDEDEPSMWRVKPESQLVPFTFEDAEFLIGKVIKVKEGCFTSLFHGVCAMITVVGNKGIDIGGRGEDPATYDTLLNYFTFLDGTPCGKLVNK